MTLIEVMIALAILTGSLLGMGVYITRFSHATANATVISAASDLAVERLEQIKAYGSYPTLETAYVGTETSFPSHPGIPSGMTRQTLITHTVTASTDYKAVTVIVTAPSLSSPVKKSTIISAF